MQQAMLTAKNWRARIDVTLSAGVRTGIRWRQENMAVHKCIWQYRNPRNKTIAQTKNKTTSQMSGARKNFT
jgi:hypothetical protein